MNLAKTGFVRAWLASLAILRKNPLYVLFSGALDVVFLISLGVIGGFFLPLIEARVVHAGTLLSPLLREGKTLMQAALSPELSPHVGALLLSLLLFAFALYALLCAFQQPIWWYAHALSGKKILWKPHFFGFARVTCVLFALFVLWYVARALAGVRSALVAAVTQQPGPAGLRIFLLVLLVVLGYLAFVSLPLLSVKKGVVLGVRKAGIFIPGVVLVVLKFVAANALLGAFSGAFKFLLSGVLLVVLLAWARLYAEQLARVAS